MGVVYCMIAKDSSTCITVKLVLFYILDNWTLYHSCDYSLS